MTEAEKSSHVLRKLGLGAGKFVLEESGSLSAEQLAAKLIDFDAVDEKFPVSPWSFAVQGDGKLYTDPYQIAMWWGLRLLMTRRPLQEKLTVFWHDHFAVSGEKVFEGPTMLGYNEILRRHGAGKFRDLLKAVSKHAALISYLDAGTSTKSHPNENFAREVFELFTLGIGNYDEKDVREAARAFTGWSLHFSGIGDETPYEKLAERAARQGMSMFNFCVVPAHHDDGSKSILGKSGALDGDAVLDILADHPQTAKNICAKLWEFFAYPKPEAAVLDSLVAAWKKSDGEIRAVLRAIVARPEFWGEKCVRQVPKSPLDWTVGLFRSLGVADLLLTMVGDTKDPYKAVREDLRKAGGGVFYLMSQQGMSLLFPPNVGGWEWGNAWITANNTITRVNHSFVLFLGEDANRPIAQYVAGKLKAGGADSAAKIVDFVASLFDVPLLAQERDVMIEACTRVGGPGSLDDKDRAAGLLAELTKLMFAVPSFQLC
ncbi:MAG: DUF1800 domain-containing protein [Armatimonadetes bacterium]|nr:DUF1800 domain-containing protein [Armatimonadota bacterium]